MSKIFTIFRNILGFRQLALLWLCVLSFQAMAQVRKPASYIPDDDLIIKPFNNEVSFYQQYVASDRSEEVLETRNQIVIWNQNQMFAEQYGLDSTLSGSPYFVPTPEEKWEYFKDKYFRYLRRKGEKPFKDMPKNWYQEYRASNEIDTIDEMEERFKKDNSRKQLPDSFQKKEVSVWKDTKFIFQPRLDQALVIVGVQNKLLHARAWVGLNGETEFNIKHENSKLGYRIQYNYYIHSGEYYTSLDKRLYNDFNFRLTSSKDPKSQTTDNTVMLLYAKTF
jgi:hypothetical protein